MTDTSRPFTVQSLFAEKDAVLAKKRAQEAAAAEAKREELRAFTEKVMTYQITEGDKAGALAKIRRAFENGEKDVMLVHFPSSLCEDDGRRINNRLEGWQDTLPGAFKQVYAWWQAELEPGGFTFGARIISYDEGIPGDVGIFIAWPEREH